MDGQKPSETGGQPDSPPRRKIEPPRGARRYQEYERKLNYLCFALAASVSTFDSAA